MNSRKPTDEEALAGYLHFLGNYTKSFVVPRDKVLGICSMKFDGRVTDPYPCSGIEVGIHRRKHSCIYGVAARLIESPEHDDFVLTKLYYDQRARMFNVIPFHMTVERVLQDMGRMKPDTIATYLMAFAIPLGYKALVAAMIPAYCHADQWEDDNAS